MGEKIVSCFIVFNHYAFFTNGYHKKHDSTVARLLVDIPTSSLFVAERPIAAAALTVGSRICNIYLAPNRKSSVDVCNACHIFKWSILEKSSVDVCNACHIFKWSIIKLSLDCYLDLICGFRHLTQWLVATSLDYGAHHV